MEELRITITRPPHGWPLAVLIEAGGYESTLCIVAHESQCPMRTADVASTLSRVVATWLLAGPLGARATWLLQSEARSGRPPAS